MCAAASDEQIGVQCCELHTGAYTCFCVVTAAQRKELLSFRDERTVLFQLLPTHLTPSAELIPKTLVKSQ